MRRKAALLNPGRDAQSAVGFARMAFLDVIGVAAEEKHADAAGREKSDRRKS
ncbi:MAG: hypothetical protein QME32_07815 [Endomicrobiia bacterium]|nr:hypothetical protein [Endomicrobiia bacterium]